MIGHPAEGLTINEIAVIAGRDPPPISSRSGCTAAIGRVRERTQSMERCQHRSADE